MVYIYMVSLKGTFAFTVDKRNLVCEEAASATMVEPTSLEMRDSNHGANPTALDSTEIAKIQATLV